MKNIFFLVKFFDNPNHADDFVHGRIFANRLLGSRRPKIATRPGAWIGMRVRLVGCNLAKAV